MSYLPTKILIVSLSAPCFLSHRPSSAGCCGMLIELSSGIKRSLIFWKKNANCEGKKRNGATKRSSEAVKRSEWRGEGLSLLESSFLWSGSHDQKRVEKMARLRWMCMICAFVCLYLSELLTHLNSEHRRYSNFRQKCGLPDCPANDKEYTSVNSLVKHVRSKHRSLLHCTYDDACPQVEEGEDDLSGKARDKRCVQR